MKVLTINTNIRPRIEYRESKKEGILNYDTDNAYPQRMMVFIDSSGQATRCVKLLTKFYIGGGFNDKTFYKSVVNREGLTMDKLLRKISWDKSYFDGFAIHVNWNANYKIDSLHHVPFEHCRLGIPDDMEYVGKIAVYTDWARWKSKRIESKFIDWMHVFNPDPAVIQAQVDAAGGWDKYTGQIFYCSCENYSEYPKSPFDPVIDDIDSDSQCAVFKNRNVRNNFVATHIGKYRGKFDTDEERQLFAESLRINQGAENASNIYLVELGGSEDSFELQEVKQANIEKLYQYTEESVRDNIRRVILAPQVLVGDFIQGKLGTATEIQDAVLFFNAATADERLEIEESITELFQYWKDPAINPTGDYTIIPLQKFMIGEPLQAKKEPDSSQPASEPIDVPVNTN